MFSRLLRNVAVSAVAYGVISGVGLLLAPFLISIYGLAGYGQILLARIFLPNAFFGLLDLGIGETTIRAVAHARARNDWHPCGATLALLISLAGGISIMIGGAVAGLAPFLPGWLGIAADQQAGFTNVLLLTAILQPFLFFSLIAEGILKGLEQFKNLRSCEIASALFQGVSAVTLGIMDFGPNWIAASLLASLIFRFALVTTIAVRQLGRHHMRLRRWSPANSQDVFRWTRLMMGSKFLGTIQHQLASPLIGLLIGPAAVGAYDAAVRLPRFSKTVFGLLSTTVMPLSASLRATNENDQIARLGYYGILGAYSLTAPFAIFAMFFSQAILSLWLGAAVAQYWPWQSAMFLIVLLNVPLSFGSAILLADHAASQAMLKLTVLQVLLQSVGALALLGTLHQWAFVLAQTVSVCLVFPMQLRLLHDRLGLPGRLAWSMLRISLWAIAIWGSAAWFFPGVHGVWELLSILAIGTSVFIAGMPALTMDREERAFIISAARGLRRRKPMDAV